MKTTGRAIAAIMLMFAAVLVTGCTKDFWTHENDTPDEVTINPEYVPIDWETTTVTTYDDSTGDYTIRFADTVPDIHPGSVIAIDRDTVVLYRFVLTANTSGNTMSLTTTDAYLTDIFSDTEFTLTTEAQGKSSTKGVVLYPVAAYMQDGNGKYRALGIEGGRKDGTRFTHNLWHYGFNNDGLVLHSGDNHSITMDQMNLDVDIDMEMYINFGGRDVHEIVGDAIDRYMSRALEVNAALVGRFNTEQLVRCRAWGSSHVTSPTFTVKSNVLPPLSMKFMAGAVPIVIVLQSDLCCQAEVTTSGEIEAYTGFTDHAEGRMGFEWQQTNGISPVSTFENSFTFTPPTIEGKGEIRAKIWAFPRISVMLYKIIGPSFDFMTYSTHTLRGGFREQMLGQTNDYFAWNYDYNVGLDLRCGLNLNLFGSQFLNDIVGSRTPSTPIRNVTDRLLYHSPKKVVHASGRPTSGQSATVYFDVYDQEYLFGREVKTSLRQIVKFEASGSLSSEYGIAHNGTVQVSWTPNGNDTLWAKLYDQDGHVLSFDTVIVKCDCNLTSGDWVDLGLPSGLLWATRNVGASSPTDYGNYYAWGETSPKSVYGGDNYRYFRQDSNTYGYTKYYNISSYGYKGFTDNLTTLQPDDDAATANYGGRMPTRVEWQELGRNTTIHWTTINGVYGACFTGSNGNSLFLPAAGYRENSSLYSAGARIVFYWSSQLTLGGSPEYAWCFFCAAGGSEFRTIGCSVRAVRQP